MRYETTTNMHKLFFGLGLFVVVDLNAADKTRNMLRTLYELESKLSAGKDQDDWGSKFGSPE